jgi:hypothetical protein
MNQDFERLAAELRGEADRAHFTDLTEPAVTAASRPRRATWLRTRAATVTAGLMIGLGSFGGVAYASNGAAPGDLLYGLDRALEAVGLGDGGAAERLAEVQALIDQGDAARGLHHAVESVLGMSEGIAEARDALLAAADRVAVRSAEAEGPPEGLADLLTYLSENIDAVDGPTVAELAKLIGPDPGGPPEGLPGPPEGVPGPPDDTPGRSENSPGPPGESSGDPVVVPAP